MEMEVVQHDMSSAEGTPHGTPRGLPAEALSPLSDGNDEDHLGLSRASHPGSSTDCGKRLPHGGVWMTTLSNLQAAEQPHPAAARGTPTGVKRSDTLTKVLHTERVKGVQTKKANQILNKVLQDAHTSVERVATKPRNVALSSLLISLVQPYSVLTLAAIGVLILALCLEEDERRAMEWRVVEVCGVAAILGLHLALDVSLAVRRASDLFKKFTALVDGVNSGQSCLSGNVEGLAGLRGADSCRILSVLRNSEDSLETVLLTEETAFTHFTPIKQRVMKKRPSEGESEGPPVAPLVSFVCHRPVEDTAPIEPLGSHQPDVMFSCEIFVKSRTVTPSIIMFAGRTTDSKQVRFVANVSEVKWRSDEWLTVEVAAEVEDPQRVPDLTPHRSRTADRRKKIRRHTLTHSHHHQVPPSSCASSASSASSASDDHSNETNLCTVVLTETGAAREAAGQSPLAYANEVYIRRVSVLHSKWRWHSLPEALTVADHDFAMDTGKMRIFCVRENLLRKCLLSLFLPAPMIDDEEELPLIHPPPTSPFYGNRSFGSQGEVGAASTTTQPQNQTSLSGNAPLVSSPPQAAEFRRPERRFTSVASAPDLMSRDLNATPVHAQSAQTPEERILRTTSPFLSPADSSGRHHSRFNLSSTHASNMGCTSVHSRMDSADAFDVVSAGSFELAKEEIESVSTVEEEPENVEDVIGQASGSSRPTTSQNLLFVVQRGLALLVFILLSISILVNVVRLYVSDVVTHLSYHDLFIHAPVGILIAGLPFSATIVLRILDCYGNSCLRSMIEMQNTSLRVVKSRRGNHADPVLSEEEHSVTTTSGSSITSSGHSDVGGGDIFGSVNEGQLQFGCYNSNLSGREAPSRECEQTGIQFETLSHPSINRRMVFRHMWSLITNQVSVGPKSSQQSWWSGTYDLVQSRNACQIFGSLSVLACVDKVGILSEVVPVPEKVLVMKRKEKEKVPDVKPERPMKADSSPKGEDAKKRKSGGGDGGKKKDRVTSPISDDMGLFDLATPDTSAGSSGYRASPATIDPAHIKGIDLQASDTLSPQGVGVGVGHTLASPGHTRQSLDSSLAEDRAGRISWSEDEDAAQPSEDTVVVNEHTLSESDVVHMRETEEREHMQKQHHEQQQYHDMAFLTLEMHKDVFAENLLQFADPDWTRHLPQLKPLGLTASLHCLQYLEEEVAGVEVPRSQPGAPSQPSSSHRRREGRKSKRPQTSSHMREQLHFDDTILWGKCLYFLGKEIGFSERLLTASGYKVKKRIHTLRPMERLRRRKRTQNGPETYTNTTNYDSTLDGRQQMASLVVIDPEGQYQLLSIGAPQFILEYTTDYWNGEEVLPLTSTDRKELQYCSNEWRRQRDLVTVAFAYRPLPPHFTKFLEQDSSGEAVHILESNEPGGHGRNGGNMFTSGDEKESMDDSDESYCGERHPLDGLTTEQTYQRIQRKQIFIGMVGSRSPPKDMVQDAIIEFGKAGIRFIHFNPENERMTKAFGEKLGLWTTANDWNCCISLKKDAAVGFSSIKARLPSGIKEIREHLVSTDNVPLLVPLFCDSRPVATKKMISILQENCEVVACIGSCLNHTSTPSFFQADIGISTMPTCNTLLMHKNRSLTASRLTLFGLPGCPIGKELQGSELDKVHTTFQKSLKSLFNLGGLVSLPSSIRLAPTEYPLYLLLCLVKQARLQLHCALKIADAVVSWSMCWAVLMWLSSLAMLPPVLSLTQLLFHLFCMIPGTAFALNEPFESLMCLRVMTILPKKNALTEQWSVLKHLAKHWLIRYLPTTLALGAVFVWSLSHGLEVDVADLLPVSEALVNDPDRSYDNVLQYSQHITMVCATLFFSAHSVGCLSRHLRIRVFQIVETDEGKRRPHTVTFRRKVSGEHFNPFEFHFFLVVTLVVIVVQICFTVITLWLVEADGGGAMRSYHPRYLPCAVVFWIIAIVVMDDLNKIWRKRHYLDKQVWRKFQFDTRLGMHSPRGDDHGDEDKGALKEAKQTTTTYWDFAKSLSL